MKYLLIVMFFLLVPITMIHFEDGRVLKGLFGIALMAATAFVLDYLGRFDER